MKAALLVTFLIVGQALASPQMTFVSNLVSHPKDPSLDLCNVCVQFTGQALNELLNIILNAGVVGGCGELCQLLDEKVNNKVLDAVCNLLCDYVGIKEFIDLIEKADLDPIYFCELATLCKVKDDGDAKIIALTVNPKTVDYGSKFVIEMQFQTVNGTGTGMIDLNIDTVDHMPLGDSLLMEPQDPGTYNVKWTVTAAPDPNCDPTQDFCEMWLPGNYTANVAVCNGECGSKHPHSQIYDTAKAPFSVVKN